MPKNGTVYCDCGHETGNPVWIGHLDHGELESFPVCPKCVGLPFIREAVVAAFGDAMIRRKREWDGLSKKEREREAQRVVKAKKKEGDE